ncbi:MAG TPA: hypothetical protein VKR83_02075 [Ktedonobacteraceae bacterium]|nr:hypothetical protein [Ktedonobacteraceae bacterium]
MYDNAAVLKDILDAGVGLIGRYRDYALLDQEFWRILSQWVWNLRLEFGQHLSPTPMHTTEFAPANEISPASELAPTLTYGPPQWARRSFTRGFAGADFVLQPEAPSSH